MTKRKRSNEHLQPHQTHTKSTITRAAFVGPLPPPAVLQHFDQVLPGLAERIVSMAEGNAKDRWRNNRAKRATAIMGQILAFILIGSALAGGFWLVHEGKDVAGIGTIITALGIPLGALYLYRREKD